MKTYKSILIICLLTLSSLIVFSQPDPTHNGNGTGVGTTPVGNSPAGAPINGGIGILLVLGLGYAGKKASDILRRND